MDINREVRRVFPQQQSAGTFTRNYQLNGVWFAGAVGFLPPSVLPRVGSRNLLSQLPAAMETWEVWLGMSARLVVT